MLKLHLHLYFYDANNYSPTCTDLNSFQISVDLTKHYYNSVGYMMSITANANSPYFHVIFSDQIINHDNWQFSVSLQLSLLYDFLFFMTLLPNQYKIYMS